MKALRTAGLSQHFPPPQRVATRHATFRLASFITGGVLALGLAAARPGVAFDAASFAPSINISLPGGAVNVAVGDLNGDGKLDVVVPSHGGGTISVFRNIGTTGGFSAASFAAPVVISVGSITHQARLADVDGDGKLDILAVNTGSGTISILRNLSTNGTITAGSFAPKINLPTTSDPRLLAIADLNADGKPDLAVTCYGSSKLSVFENASTPGSIVFGARVDLVTGEAYFNIGTGDIDGDGVPEIVVNSAANPTVAVFRNLNTGGPISAASFAAAVNFSVGSGGSVALGDLDGDGKLDLVSANQGADTLSVLRNTATAGVIGTNSFAPKVNFAAPGYPFSSVISDLDGDGKPDIAVAKSTSGSVAVFKNVAQAGSFTTTSLTASVSYAVNSGARLVSVGDMDGDGLPDLLTGNLDAATFSVLRQTGTNTPPPPPPSTNLLVSLWHGEGNALDSAGSNHGTLQGGVNFTAGAVGQGFLLDGVNDYIRVPDSASLHLAGELTVEMWFKRQDAASYGALIDKRDWTTCNYGVIMSGDWGFQLYYNDPNVYQGNLFEISFSSVPAPGVFHHLAATLRQADASHVEMKTYIDGALVRTDTRPGNLASTFNGDALAIGTARDGADGYFRGVIDEVAIYNYALSPAQISSNFSNVTLPPPPPPPPPTVPALVSLWHGESNALDSVGSNHGTLLGGAGFGPGAVGLGFKLDGENDYIRVPDSASLHLANELTVEMWFLREDASSYGALIDKRDWTTCNYGVIMSSDWGFQLYYNDPNVSLGNLFEISFSAVPAPGVFHHLAGTFRQTDAEHVEMKTYIDGQLVRSDTRRGNLAGTFNGDALAIGTARDGADGYFHGVIDEVAIYNYALNADQVFSNFSAVVPPPPPPPPPATNAPGSLVALWHGEGNALDSVGNNHGTLLGGAGFVPGVSGQGFLLDGVNDYIRVPDSAALHLSGALSVEMWFQRADAASFGTLIDKRSLNNCNFGVIMSGDWGFQLYYNDPAVYAGNLFEISFSSVPGAGVFHHLVATYRQASPNQVELKTYVDGQLIRTDVLAGNLANTFNGSALAIGSARDGADAFFRGVIDEVALYNYALSPSQVTSNYLAQSVVTGPQIVTQPASRTVLAGEPAGFEVVAFGTPPLSYQWRFNGGTLAGKTNYTLSLPATEVADAGAYRVVVFNNSGSVTSAVATLTVSDSGLPPAFVTPPAPFYSALAGASVTMSSVVSGTPPLRFQWSFAGVAMPGATNPSLTLNNVQAENAGRYALVVTNDYGSVASAGSTLNVSFSGGGGTLNFFNPGSNLVYDVGGSMPLPSGTGYVAAVYVGSSSNTLTAVGGPAGFVVPGHFLGGTRTVSFIPAGQPAFVQVRVWDAKVSATYEEALALGAKRGASPVFVITLGGGLIPPTSLQAMPGFALEPGTGVVGRRKLAVAGGAPARLSSLSRAGGAAQFILSGPVGATYAVEVSSDLVSWTLVNYVVNNTGAVRFTDDSGAGSENRFYRARLVNP